MQERNIVGGFTAAVLSEGGVCTCNKYKLVLRNIELIGNANDAIARFENTREEIYGRMPEPSYEIREAIVAVPPTPEPPAEGDGGNSDNEEPTEGGGE
jgi:hypothetical protein